MPEYFQASPISFYTKAIRCPSAFSRMCRITAVFPAPRKPVTTVTGVFEIMSSSSTKFAAAVRHSLNPTVPVEGGTLINNRPDRRQASLNPCFLPLAGSTNAAFSAPRLEKSKADRYSQCRGIATEHCRRPDSNLHLPRTNTSLHSSIGSRRARAYFWRSPDGCY